jgi:serine protease
VYLRVWNLGADANTVTATAYWSPPATLVTTPMWYLIGHAQYPAVPAGRAVEVSSPGITWAQAATPGPGHYCFVATVGAASESRYSTDLARFFSILRDGSRPLRPTTFSHPPLGA